MLLLLYVPLRYVFSAKETENTQITNPPQYKYQNVNHGIDENFGLQIA
jgi:hypothetical protein